MKTKEDFNNWTKGCECENSIGQTWCCNQCGLPYDTRKSKSVEISDGYESLWGKTDFADTLEKAPQYDYHTSNDVLNRLMDLL